MLDLQREQPELQHTVTYVKIYLSETSFRQNRTSASSSMTSGHGPYLQVLAADQKPNTSIVRPNRDISTGEDRPNMVSISDRTTETWRWFLRNV